MNQRDFFRVNVNESCTMRLSKLGQRILPLDEIFDVSVNNISASGLSFTTNRDLPDSNVLTWQFYMRFLVMPFDLYGQVARKHNVGTQFQYGVRFIFLDDNQQQELTSCLHLFQSRQKMKEKMTNP